MHELESNKMFIQYCAKVTQTKCANFVLCPCELSKKVCEKVQVTFQDLLSKSSLEQRTLFHRFFGAKRYFPITIINSLTQCPKFRFKQTQQFFTWSISIYLSYNIHKVFISFWMHFLTGVQSRTERMRITSKTYHKWRLSILFHSRRDKT